MIMDSHDGMIVTGELKNLEKNLSQCHFVHHKFHMYSPRLPQ
jgi:hypothetical protein